jgi:hypothetical protein
VGLRFKTTQDLIHRLDDADYTGAETFTLKLPFAVPYNDDSREYKRVDGEIEYQGEYYRMVKQKLSNDTLYIVCLKDHQSRHIKQALNDYVKTFTDKPVNTSPQNTKIQVGFIKDYLPVKIALTSDTTGWTCNSTHNSRILDLASNPYTSLTSPPPKA